MHDGRCTEAFCKTDSENLARRTEKGVQKKNYILNPISGHELQIQEPEDFEATAHELMKAHVSVVCWFKGF